MATKAAVSNKKKKESKKPATSVVQVDYGIRISDTELLPSQTLIVRMGEGIHDDVLPDIAMFQIDSEVPLINRGLKPDCVKVFNLDHYLPQDVRDYRTLEGKVMAEPRFARIWTKVKAIIFKEIPNEAENWEKLLDNSVDKSGAGALVSQGALKLVAAMMGRDYDYLRDDPLLHPELPYRYDTAFWKDLGGAAYFDPMTKGQGLVRVSILHDLQMSIDAVSPAMITESGGAFGGTGPSGAIILRTVMSQAGWDVMPAHTVALPEMFMGGEKIHPQVQRRIAQIANLIRPSVLFSGLGANGVYWRFLQENMMTLFERFSNVASFAMERNAANLISVIGVPLRDDLETRWLVALGALSLSTTTVEKARETVLEAVEAKLLTIKPIKYDGGKDGVQIWVNNPQNIKVRYWQDLMPALAVARSRTVHKDFFLPITLGGGMFSSKKVINAPVIEVPHMDKLLQNMRLDIDTVQQAVGHWAITRIEALLIEQVSDRPLARAFDDLRTGFLANVREIIHSLIDLPTCFSPSEVVYHKKDGAPATAIFLWVQFDAPTDVVCRKLLELFGPLDDRDQILKVARQKAEIVGKKTAQVN